MVQTVLQRSLSGSGEKVRLCLGEKAEVPRPQEFII